MYRDWKTNADFKGAVPSSTTTISSVRDAGTFYVPINTAPNITDFPNNSYKTATVTLKNNISEDGDYIEQQIYTSSNYWAPHIRLLTTSGNVYRDWKTNADFINSNYTSSISNLTWTACGDSFTHGDFTGTTAPTIKTGKYAGELAVYPFIIGNRNGMKVNNIALNGQRMGGEDGFAATYLSNIPADSNIITLAFGINDTPSHKNTPIGTINDNTTDTFYGSWNITMDYLFTNFPTAHIGIIVTNGIPYSEKEYSEAIIAIAEKWCVPYLNEANGTQVPTLNRSGKNPDSHSNVALNNRTAAFVVSSTNMHPNAKAHEYESHFIENWLETI